MKNIVKVTKTELMPTSSRKSFYGRAFVLEGKDSTHWLQSYNTIMCSVDRDGHVRRHSDYRSNTTDCHVKAFLETFAPDMDPAEFRKLEVEPRPTLVSAV